MSGKITKILSLLLCLCLVFQQSGLAQVAAELNIAGHFAALRNSFIQDKFRPLHLRYLAYDSSNNNFKLLLDKGDSPLVIASRAAEGGGAKQSLDEANLRQETKMLLNYFFIGISLPNDSFWVNLRPDSPDNIINEQLAKTDVGRILLEADLQLKKDTAKFTSPETPEGKEYWDKLYRKAGEIFGSENIAIPTLTRPWIVPDEIIIRESSDNAYIYKATLKVMLEEDYLQGSGFGGQGSVNYDFKDERLKALNEYSTRLIRELIIPKLTKDLNTAKRYAPLRQVYYSLILAQWFKARFTQHSSLRGVPTIRRDDEAISANVSIPNLIDSHNLTNLVSKEPYSVNTYFTQYQKSFAEGEYNLKIPVATPFGQSIRSYMSGGIGFGDPSTGSSAISAAIAKNIILGSPRRSIANLNREAISVEFDSDSGEVRIMGAAASPLEQGSRRESSSPLTAQEKEEFEFYQDKYGGLIFQMSDNEYNVIQNWRPDFNSLQIAVRLLRFSDIRAALEAARKIAMRYLELNDIKNPDMLYAFIRGHTAQEKEEFEFYQDKYGGLIFQMSDNEYNVIQNWRPDFNSLQIAVRLLRFSDIRAALEAARKIAMRYLELNDIKNPDMLYAFIRGHSDNADTHIRIIEEYRQGQAPIDYVAGEKGTPLEGLKAKVRELFEKRLFEIGTQIGKHGHYIAGGVSTGRSEKGREIIRIDWGKDIALGNVYKTIINEAKISNKNGLLDGEEKKDVLERIYYAVAKRVVYNDEYVAALEKKFRDREALLGEAVIDKGGVCRHHGILSATLLERFIQEGYLFGKCYYFRGPGHGWAMYRASTGKFLVFDIAQDYLGPMEGATYMGSGYRRYLYSDAVPQEILNESVAREIQHADAVTVLPDKSILKGASSPVEEGRDTKGGIDMRALPIMTQAMPGPLLGTPPLRSEQAVPSSSQLIAISETVPFAELNSQWRQIEQVLASGIIPSSERIKEHLISCCQNREMDRQIDKVLVCLADILRLEEGRVCSTEPALKEILILLESDKPAEELQFALSKIRVPEKKPELMAR